MRKGIALVLCLIMFAALLPAVQMHAAYADERYLEINETNFPDANFRNWIIGNLTFSGDADTGYYMTEAQVKAVLRINCSSKNIKSLAGIGNFTALYYLSCSDNQLTALDVSKNTALNFLYCENNQLTALDVKKNTALVWLICSDNQLTALDVSKNTALTLLNCYNNQLTALDVSKNTALENISCYRNQLTALDLSKNTALKILDCSDNQLTALDMSNNPALESLDCFCNQLTALNVSKNTALEYLYCYYNQLTALNLSKNTSLKELYCYNNQLTALDVSKNTALEDLHCDCNQLTALDVSKNTALQYLYCGNNNLSVLDVSKNTALISFGCNGQTVAKQTIVNDSGVYTYDLSAIVPVADMSKVTLYDTSNTLDTATGIVTFPERVDSFTYQYETDRGYMDVTVLFPVKITTQPKSVTVANGKTAKFTVKANASDVTYQWYYSKDNGANWKKLSGKTSASLKVKGSATTNGYLYRCVAMRGKTKATSKSAKLTVSGVKPKIVVQPKKATVKTGKSNTFKVVAAGSGLKYQWYYSKDNGTKWIKLSGKTSTSLKIKGSATTNGYLYRCKITNAKGSVTSKSVKLTVSGVKPKIVVQPKAASVKSGKTAKFSVVAAGTGLKYQWYYSKNAGKSWTKMSGKTAASLSVKGSKTNNGYLYRCVVKNTKGSVTSKNAKLTVK